MKCPTCGSLVDATAMSCPECKAPTPRGRRFVQATAARDRRWNLIRRYFEPLGIKRDANGKIELQRWHSAVVVAILLPAFVVGAYKLTKSWEMANDKNLQTPEAHAIAVVQQQASSDKDATVDAKLQKAISEKLTKGEIKEVEGWKAAPLADGWDVRYVYETAQGKVEAQWKVDVTKNRAEPLNDWAAQLTAKK